MNNRWKYLVVSIKSGLTSATFEQRLQEALDKHGSQGWELVQTLPPGPWGGTPLVFKKPA
jgi:hypothetical protein